MESKIDAGSLLQEASVTAQVRDDGGSNQRRSHKGGEKRSDSGCILIMEPGGFSNGLQVRCETKKRLKKGKGGVTQLK